MQETGTAVGHDDVVVVLQDSDDVEVVVGAEGFRYRRIAFGCKHFQMTRGLGRVAPNVGVPRDVRVVQQGAHRRTGLLRDTSAECSEVWVCIDRDHPVTAQRCERGAESDCRRGLSDATLEGEHCQTEIAGDRPTDACDHLVELLLRLALAQIDQTA